MKKTNIFISYSKEDKGWFDEVKKYLMPLELNYNYKILDDTTIKVGSTWEAEIEHYIRGSKVAILLISHNFYSSAFIQNKELPKILSAARNKGLIICNVLLTDADCEIQGLTKFQFLNDPKFPLSTLKGQKRNSMMVKLVKEVKSIINEGRELLEYKEDSNSNEQKIDFYSLCILKCLIRTGARSITEIQHATRINRKMVVFALNRLENYNYIVPSPEIDKNQKPTKLWQASDSGIQFFIEFESIYNQL